jgi:hypothetical protein
MAGVGTELLFFVGLGYVVLGPQRTNKLLQQIARAKRDFSQVKQNISSQLSTALEPETKDPPG